MGHYDPVNQFKMADGSSYKRHNSSLIYPPAFLCILAIIFSVLISLTAISALKPRFITVQLSYRLRELT